MVSDPRELVSLSTGNEWIPKTTYPLVKGALTYEDTAMKSNPTPLINTLTTNNFIPINNIWIPTLSSIWYAKVMQDINHFLGDMDVALPHRWPMYVLNTTNDWSLSQSSGLQSPGSWVAKEWDLPNQLLQQNSSTARWKMRTNYNPILTERFKTIQNKQVPNSSLLLKHWLRIA